jgi:hypothetical protein
MTWFQATPGFFSKIYRHDVFAWQRRPRIALSAHNVTGDHRGVDLISDALPFGRLWYGEPNAVSNAICYAKFRSRTHHALIRVYDEAGNVIETHEHAGDSKHGEVFTRITSPFPLKRISHDSVFIG